MNNKSKTFLPDNPKAQFLDLLTISASSKRITKRSKNTHSLPKEVTKPPKKYQTTKKKEKALLLDKIRKIVDPKFLNENWSKTVVKYKPPEYRDLLSQIYSNLVILFLLFLLKRY